LVRWVENANELSTTLLLLDKMEFSVVLR
jgi:hypothetical protein